MAYRLVTNLVTYSKVWPTFPGSKIFPQGYLAYFLSQRDEIWPR